MPWSFGTDALIDPYCAVSGVCVHALPVPLAHTHNNQLHQQRAIVWCLNTCKHVRSTVYRNHANTQHTERSCATPCVWRHGLLRCVSYWSNAGAGAHQEQ